MTDVARRCCENCDHWNQGHPDGDEKKGECRRYPPLFTFMGTAFPVTQCGWACGEFKVKTGREA